MSELSRNFKIRNAIIPGVSKLSRVYGRTTVRELASACGFTEVALPIAFWALEPEHKTADIGDKIQNLCISDTPKALRALLILVAALVKVCSLFVLNGYTPCSNAKRGLSTTRLLTRFSVEICFFKRRAGELSR
jgi:hypothetical protein